MVAISIFRVLAAISSKRQYHVSDLWGYLRDRFKMEETLSDEYATGESFYDASNKALAMDVTTDVYGHVIGRYDCLHSSASTEQSYMATRERKRSVAQKDASSSFLTNRSLCITEKGHLGLVPVSAEAGDLIWVFLSSKVLHTVRGVDSGSEYESVGECHLHGLMDGNAVDWVEDGASKVERFVFILAASNSLRLEFSIQREALQVLRTIKNRLATWFEPSSLDVSYVPCTACPDTDQHKHGGIPAFGTQCAFIWSFHHTTFPFCAVVVKFSPAISEAMPCTKFVLADILAG